MLGQHWQLTAWTALEFLYFLKVSAVFNRWYQHNKRKQCGVSIKYFAVYVNIFHLSSKINWLHCSLAVSAVERADVSYLYFMPVFMLCSLEEGTLWTESCPRLRATIATALNLLRVPVLGLLAFCRFSRSSVLRLTPPRWSVHTSDTCILTLGQLPKLRANALD